MLHFPFNFLVIASIFLMSNVPLIKAQESVPTLNKISTSDNIPFNTSLRMEETPYTLGPGDVISLDIFDVPEYSKVYQVLIDGTINLPLINKLSVAGLTLSETQALITKMYSERQLLTDPILAVNLVQPRPINVAIIGDVRNPGAYVIPFQSGNTTSGAISALQFPRLIDALQIAEGINASADETNVQVIRYHKGQEISFVINLQQFLNDGDLNQDLILRDGDRIIVPTVESMDIARIKNRATANFSANLNVPIQINIIGEINRPGPYTLDGQEVKSENLNDQLQFNDTTVQTEKFARFSTATTAIRYAGGLTGRADIRNIQIRRTISSEREQLITVNLWELLQNGDLSEDALLKDGDVIIVPTAEEIEVETTRQIALASFSPNNINVNIVGEVKSPGPKQLSPNITLQQAILAAGGFDNRRAKEVDAELIRLNPDGTVSRSTITVNFGANIDPNNNPPLLNDDIVIVKRNNLTTASDFLAKLTDPIRQILSLITPFSLF